MIPYSLNIGLTNRCNLKCSFCPVSGTKIERTDMPLWLALRVIKEVSIKHHISLALFGESTLYKDLPKIVEAIKRKGVQSILYTNGLNIDRSLTDIDKIVFSIDAFSKEEYLQIKGVDGYNKALGNARYFAEHTNTTVQFADLKYKKKELPDVGKANVKFGRFISWGGEIDWQSDSKRKIRLPKPCAHIFKFLNVASNGDVVMCCIDYNHSVVLGNVYDDNTMDIWDGEKFNKLRNAQKQGEFSNLCLNCENESYYSP